MVTDHLTGEDLNQPWGWPNVELEQLFEHLKRLPADDQLRLEAIALARRYARPSDLIKKPDRGAAYHHLAHDRLRFAWRVLFETGVLHQGMTFEQAAMILGRPDMVFPQTNEGVTLMEWSYESIMHINPALICSIKAGVIERIEVVNK